MLVGTIRKRRIRVKEDKDKDRVIRETKSKVRMEGEIGESL